MVRTRSQSPRSPSSTDLTLALPGSASPSAQISMASAASPSAVPIASTTPPVLSTFSISMAPRRAFPSPGGFSIITSDPSLRPINLTTVISPVTSPGLSYRVMTPYAVGYSGIMTHSQEIQNALYQTFWNSRCNSVPSASSSSSQASASASALTLFRGDRRHHRYEPYARWFATPIQRAIMTEIYHRSRGQIPSPDESTQLAMFLREYGEIEGANVYYWFRNFRTRGGPSSTLTPPEPLPSSPLPVELPLFPLRPGDLARSRRRHVPRDIDPATAGDDAHITRLELRTRQADERQ